MNPLYKLVIKNSKLVVKTINAALIYLRGIKDTSGSGTITAGIVDLTIQQRTQTTAQWNADTTTILLRGQLGVEDTGNTTFKIKIGNGTDLWSALGYAGGGSGSAAWGAITGTLSSQTDLQNALNAKEDSITAGTTSQYWRGDKSWQTLNTDAVTEAANLYFTDARALSAAPAETTTTIGTLINGATDKATPVDADYVGLMDSTASNILKKLSWANIKATLKTYFDTIYTRPNLGIQAGHILVTSGTSFTTPSNITTNTTFKIHVIGAGGGGGGINTGGGSASGGGGGGVALVWITGLTPSTTYTCAIGTGGSGGGSPGDGTDGGNTTLTIGATTYTGGGGGKGIGAVSSAGGAGGTATNGTINFTGQNGGDSPALSAASTDGNGGNSALGFGLGGALSRPQTSGKSGSGYGGGGSGGKGTAQSGGNGANGAIYAEYFN